MNKKRIVPPNDADLVENTYNIGIYNLEQDACEVDTEYTCTCLYVRYCDGNYCDAILEDGTFPVIYKFINGLADHALADTPSTGEIEQIIRERLLEEIIGYDETFDEHMGGDNPKCPAAEPDGVDNLEEAAMLWCKYVLERGPRRSRN